MDGNELARDPGYGEETVTYSFDLTASDAANNQWSDLVEVTVNPQTIGNAAP